MFSDRWLRLLPVIAVFLMMPAVSCSVKEDRDRCPCFLTLDFSDISTADLLEKGFDSVDVLMAGADGFAVTESWTLNDFVKEYCVPVPRSGVDIMAVCRTGGTCSVEEGLMVNEGEECPELYMFSESFTPNSAEDRRQVVLHRNYCRLSVCLKTMFDVPARPFRVMVVGNVNGYLLDGTPKEGAFRYFSAPSSVGLCTCLIPRQKDDSMQLAVHFLDSDEIRAFPVGEYIRESGYDWNSADLEDICVEMDFSRTGVTFSISKWKKTLSFDITF